MISGMYQFADVTVCIRSMYEGVHQLCSEYICDGTPDVTITVDADDLSRERAKTLISLGKSKTTSRRLADDYLEKLAAYRKIAEIMPDYQTLLIHGSAICLDGEGYLFTAKSGTGKSTHTRLWREAFGERAFMVNDDKPLLKCSSDGIFVCGTPWDGKHHLSKNCAVPLKAICILQRGETNKIHAVSATKALPHLIEQCYRPENTAGFLKTLNLLDAVTKTVKFYSLSCNMEIDAAITAFQGMQ